MYDISLKRKWDNKAVLDYAEQRSVENGKQVVVENLLTIGDFTMAIIANFVTVSEDFVKKVRANLSKEK